MSSIYHDAFKKGEASGYEDGFWSGLCAGIVIAGLVAVGAAYASGVL